MNLTGIRLFSLMSKGQKTRAEIKLWLTYEMGWAGLPPRHVVCTFTSIKDCGGPLDVYVGVNDGSQKSGSLLRRASACSRSISRRAASSASCARVSTVEESKANLRFVPLALRIHVNGII